MAISDEVRALEAAKDTLEEAWDKGAAAKETAAEGLDKLLAVVGPESNAPDVVKIAIDMIQEGRNQIEQGQALMSSAQDKIQDYIDQISS